MFKKIIEFLIMLFVMVIVFPVALFIVAVDDMVNGIK